MSNPIVIAHHLIWTLYGWWLPNDLRGSTSKAVRSPHVAKLGELHFGRKSIQPASRNINAFYEAASKVLKFPLIELDISTIQIVAAGFADAIALHKYTCYACAILSDHIHILIRKHKHQAEEMIENLKESSRLRLSAVAHFPQDHPIWTENGGWKTFLDHPDEIHRTIKYIQDNPLPYHMPIQHWPFVSEYDGWPLHPGHNMNSPYVRALKAAGRYPR